MKTYKVYYEPVLSLEVTLTDESTLYDAIVRARATPREQWECSPDDFREYRAEALIEGIK